MRDKQLSAEIVEKESLLQQLEQKIRQDIRFAEQEKSRAGRQLADLEQREKDIHSEMAKEKELIRQEYARIDRLQTELQKQEALQQDEYLKKLVELEAQQHDLDAESLRVKQEISDRRNDFELKYILFQKSRNEFGGQQQALEKVNKEKIKEIEGVRLRLVSEQNSLDQKMKALELQEYDFDSTFEAYNRRFAQLKYEQLEFEKRQKHLNEMIEESRKEQDKWLEFKQNYASLQRQLTEREEQLRVEEERLNEDQAKIKSQQLELNAKNSQ